MMVLAGLLTTSTLTLVAADGVPTFDIDKHCRDAAGAAGPTSTVEGCVNDERATRDQVAKQWSRYNAGDRDHCLKLTTMAGDGTYTQLLTCLEMNQAARQMRSGTGERTGERK